MTASDKPPVEPTSPPPPSPGANAPGPAPAEPAIGGNSDVFSDDEFSLANVDEILQGADPAFLTELNAISADKNISIAEIEIDDRPPLKVRIKAFLWSTSKRVSNRLRDTGIIVYRKGWKFLKGNALRARDAGKSFGATVGGWLAAFRQLALKMKLLFVALVLVAGGLLGTFYWQAKTRWLFNAHDLFVTSMASRAQEKFEYDDTVETEPFYDNIRSTPNVLLIQKSIVNIRASASSGENPMAAFELFIEGFNPEVVAEIKVREGFFRDLIHGTVAKFTYDEIESVDGKRELLGVIRKELNSVVRQGQVKVVRFKTIILKP